MTQGPNYAYFQGKIVPIEEAKISVMTHALHYGTGAFGGIRRKLGPTLRTSFRLRHCLGC